MTETRQAITVRLAPATARYLAEEMTRTGRTRTQIIEEAIALKAATPAIHDGPLPTVTIKDSDNYYRVPDQPKCSHKGTIKFNGTFKRCTNCGQINP